MTYEVSYSNQAAKFLRNADRSLASRIIEKIERISKEPVYSGIKKIIGSKDLYRARVGDIRILYRIDHPQKHVDIVKIDKRGLVYQR